MSTIFESYNFDKPLSSYDVKQLDINIGKNIPYFGVLNF